MVGLGFKWVVLPALVWLLGQGVLIGLTLWDPNWDDVAWPSSPGAIKTFMTQGNASLPRIDTMQVAGALPVRSSIAFQA